MEDREKTKEQLMRELKELRQEIAQLESGGIRGCNGETDQDTRDSFKCLIEGAPDAVFIQTGGVFSFLNEQALKLFGATSTHELLGKPVFERFHADFHEAIQERIRLLNIEKKRAPSLEQIYLRMDGSPVNVDVSAVPIHFQGEDGALVFVRDITERKLADREIKESRERLEFALRGADLGWWVLDLTTGIGIIDNRMHEMIGYSPGEIPPTLEVWQQFVHPDDLTMALEHIQQHVQGHSDSLHHEYRIRKKSGDYAWVLAKGKIVEYDTDDKPLRMAGTVMDITPRKTFEQKLRLSEERLDLALKAANLGLWDLDLATGKAIINERAAQIFGYTLQEVNATVDFWQNSIHPDDRPRLQESFRLSLENKQDFFQLEYRLRAKSGEYIWILSRGNTVERDATGNPLRMSGTFMDITSRIQRDEALRESEKKYRSLFENMLEGFAYCKMIFHDGKPLDFVYLDVNQSFYRLTGLKNVIGRKVTEVIPGIRETNQELFEMYGRVARTGAPEKTEIFIPPLSIWFALSVYSPEKEYFVAVFDNITEHKWATDQLRESEERYRSILTTAMDGFWLADRTGRILEVNEAYCELVGYGRGELVGKSITDVEVIETESQVSGHLVKILEEGADRFETVHRRKDGSAVEVEVSVRLLPTEEGKLFAFFRDISSRKKAEEVQRLLFAAIEQAAEGIIITDSTGAIQYVNPAEETHTGYTRDELIGATTDIFKSDKQDESFHKNMWETINAGNVWSGRFINKKKDGTEYHEDASISPIFDNSGSLTHFVAVKHDVTQQLSLQQQLLQAQKMEAVGTLAGGIAHDFNNILQVVSGYSELLLAGRKKTDKDYGELEKINSASTRGADLVQNLMMFSRKVEPNLKPMNLNEEVAQIQKLLSRTIPKNIKINLRLSGDLELVNADISQIGQVLMNLAVNARDAMPGGGVLNFETTNVELDEAYCATHPDSRPGSHVLLEVSDTGVGMSKETLSHVFDPFFTTKETGKGTGLGLPTVFGIVKQHQGHITCYSELGRGATFKVYLPAIEQRSEAETHGNTAPIMGGT